MKPEVNTTFFEFSHGRKPRGFGAWAFFFSRQDFRDMANGFWHTGSFGEARKAAIAEARRRKAFEVIVGS